MTEIKSLIYKYYDLNKIYNTIVQVKKISYEEQVIICDFYNYINQSKIFDVIIKNNITTLKTNDYNYLLNTFKIKIQENISLYTINKDLLNNLQIKSICEIASKKFDHQIEKELDYISAYRQDLKDANNKLEATAYGDFSKKEIEKRNLSYNDKRNKYKEQAKILEELFIKKEKNQKQTWQYNRNHFNDIYEWTNFLLIELNDEKTLYFDKGLIYSIYRICNDFIFENTTEEDYQNSFNSLTNPMNLKRIKGSQNYICYLIKFLSARVQNCDSDYWTNETLLRFGINKIEIYERKKNEVVNQSANQIESKFKKSKYFYLRLNEIDQIEDQIKSKKTDSPFFKTKIITN